MSRNSQRRGAVACDYCHTRKRRCDGKIPCSLCRDRGSICQYPTSPTSRDDQQTGVQSSNAHDERLARIEVSLERYSSTLHDVQRQLEQLRSHGPLTGNSCQSISPSSHHTGPLDGLVGADANRDIQFVIPEKHCTSTTWLLSHPAVRSLLGDYANNYFHTLEKNGSMPVGQTLHTSVVQHFSTSDVDFASLVDQYFSGPHQHYPIFTTEDVGQMLADGNSASQSSLASAAARLVYALGATSCAGHTQGPTDDSIATTLFTQAMRTLNDHLCWSFTPTIELCRALILAASYLAHTGRPLHSWRYAQFAFSTYREVRFGSSYGLRSAEADVLHRVYWSCFLLECDRSAELDLPRSGIETFADEIPLPLSHAQDDFTTIAFLAEISIRRLLNRIHNSLYPDRDRVPSLQVPQLQRVTEELEHQLTSWYQSIPEPVRPTLGTEPCSNDRIRILRIRYYAAMHILHRPSLLCLADHSNIDFSNSPTMASAETCIYACKTYLLNSMDMLSKRTPYLWTFSASSLGALFVLSIARSVPSLRSSVSDLAVYHDLFLEKVRPWATVESSLEAMVSMVETIVAKERHL